MKPSLIIGSKGQVASSLAYALASRPVSATSRSGGPYMLDLERLDTIEPALEAWTKTLREPGHIYLAGALTAVDACETDPARSFRINVEGPRRIAELSARLGHKLLYFSSEYVFGAEEFQNGKQGPFVEKDKPAPLGIYGQHKLEAEQAVAACQGDALIIRTTMVFSFDPSGTNFAMQVYRALSAETPGPMWKIPQDQVSTPTYAPALSTACIQLMDKNESGVFHITGRDLLSRPAFIEKIAKTFAFPLERIQKCYQFVDTKDLGQPAKRPLAAGLNCDKAVAMGVKIWTLDEALTALRQDSRQFGK